MPGKGFTTDTQRTRQGKIVTVLDDPWSVAFIKRESIGTLPHRLAELMAEIRDLRAQLTALKGSADG